MKAFKCDKCSKFFSGEPVSCQRLLIKIGSREATIIVETILNYKSPAFPSHPAELCLKCLAEVTAEAAKKIGG